jgi:hypothetical protein
MQQNRPSIGYDKMKNKKYCTVGTIPTSTIKAVERGNIDTPHTQIHDRSFSWLDTGTSIRSGVVRLVLLAQNSPLSEMMRSCKCVPYESKIPTLTYKQCEQRYYKERYNVEYFA